MKNTKIFEMSFANVYPLYITKVEKKWQNKSEVDEIIFWLTGYNEEDLARILEEKTNFENFLNNCPEWNPLAVHVTGSICGYKIEEIEDENMRKIRILDKMIDNLAKWKTLEKFLQKI